MPDWLFTCKMVLHEALEELLRQSKPTIGPHLELIPNYRGTGEWFRSGRGSLLDVMAVDDIALWLNPSSVTNYGFPYSIRNVDRKYILRLEDRTGLLSKVRKILIRAEVYCRCEELHRVPYDNAYCRLDLRHLEDYPFHLDTFEFQAIWPNYSRSSSTNHSQAKCIESFANEVQRVGRLWAGRDGALSVQLFHDPGNWHNSVLFSFNGLAGGQ